MEDKTVHQIITDYANEKSMSFEQSAIELLTHGFIKPTTIIHEPPQGFTQKIETYDLTVKGRNALSKHGSFVECLKAQAAKDELDEEKERLSLQDLRDKVHDLNPAQSFVLRGTWERHKQSLLMVLIGALIGSAITIMVKIWGH